MAEIILNYDTEEIVSGKIEKIPAEWIAREYFIPAIRREMKREETGESAGALFSPEA